MGKQIH